MFTSDTDTAASVQQVSGQTIIWALFALALSAATQSSRTNSRTLLFGRASTKSIISPRISPVFCLLDTLSEGRDLLWHLIKKTPVTHESDPPTEETTAINEAVHEKGEDVLGGSATHDNAYSVSVLCAKLALFVLGALPQAIKLFACRGIPITQTCAAIYLTAIVLHALHVLLLAETGGAAAAKTVANDRQRFLKIFSLQLFHHAAYGYLWLSLATKNFTSESHVAFGIPWALLWAAFACLVFFTILLWPCFMRLVPRYCLTHRPPVVLRVVLYVLPNCLLLPVIGYKVADGGIIPEWSSTIGKSISKGLMLATLHVPTICPPILASLSISLMLSWLFQRLPEQRDCRVPLPVFNVTLQSSSIGDPLVPEACTVADESKELGQSSAAQSHNKFTWQHLRRYVMDILLCAMYFCDCIFDMDPTLTLFYQWLSTFKPHVLWTTFLVFNVLTVTTYYTLSFDGADTINPGWTSVLGR